FPRTAGSCGPDAGSAPPAGLPAAGGSSGMADGGLFHSRAASSVAYASVHNLGQKPLRARAVEHLQGIDFIRFCACPNAALKSGRDAAQRAQRFAQSPNTRKQRKPPGIALGLMPLRRGERLVL